MTYKPNKPHDPTDTGHPLYDPALDPTHPFYEGDKAEDAQEPGPSDEGTRKTGPGFPPNEHKWPKGCPSPNPKGRPRKVPSIEPELKKIFVGALNVKVDVTRADKKILMTRLALGFEPLAIQWAKGDRHARRDVITYAAMLGVDLQPKAVIEEALGIDNQAIVEAAFLRYQEQQPSAKTEPEVRIKAPPDLVDDDVVTPKSDELRAAPPKPAPLPKKPEPELDQFGRPKPRDRAFIQAEREYNIAKNKRDTES